MTSFFVLPDRLRTFFLSKSMPNKTAFDQQVGHLVEEFMYAERYIKLTAIVSEQHDPSNTGCQQPMEIY